MKKSNWFWGLFFIAAAVFVIAGQIGAFGQIGILSIIETILLVAIVIHSVVYRNIFFSVIPFAFLYLIYQGPLHLPVISAWILILAAALAGIGLSCIFHPHWHPHADEWHYNGSRGSIYQVNEGNDDNHPSASVSFGSSVQYLHGDCIQNGKFSCSFGSLEIYFDQAQLSPDGAEVTVDCSFGSIELYIPKNWRVIDNIQTSLASVEDNRRMAQPQADAPQLILNGGVSFGDVEIHYI